MPATSTLALCCLLVVGMAPSLSYAQQPPTNAEVAATLLGEVHTLVMDLATQRDALGGWPAVVSNAYDRLTQLEADLEAARNAGDARAFRRGYRAAMRVAARITRWLVNQYDASNEQVPSLERADAIAERLSARVTKLSELASQAGIVLDLTGVNAARSQFESARANGTNAQIRMALRAFRDAIDSLQDSMPDPEN